MATKPQTKKLEETRRGLEWNDLSIILAIAREGSLSGAARALGKTHSTVFRNITAIEERTAVRFFDRIDNSYVPTDAGRAALPRAERVEAEIIALGIEILGQDTRIEGRIRVTCPEAMAIDLMPGLVAKFRSIYPDVLVDVSPGQAAVDLNRREAEIAVRATKAAPESAFGRKICAFRFALYAAPHYFASVKDTPIDEQNFCLIEGSAAWLVPAIWKTKEQGEDRAVFQCRSTRAAQNAAAEGMGLTLMPCYVGDDDPRLARISDPIESLDMQLWVLTHQDLRNSARVRAMMTFLYDELGARADLWGGRRKETIAPNLMPREGW